MSMYLTSSFELTEIADAIRARTGISSKIAFPNGFVSAINSIPAPSISYTDFLRKYIEGTLSESGPEMSKVIEIGYNAFSHFSFSLLHLENCKKIHPYAFLSDANIREIDANNCEIIGANAFGRCSFLTTCSFPKCSFVGDYAFYWCTKLSSVNFDNCEIIGSGAFSNCSSLTSMRCSKCTNIRMSAFYNCNNLSDVEFIKCRNIESNAFNSCGIINASFPACENISIYAFFHNESMITANFTSCKTVASYAFAACYNLCNVNLPECETIYSGAFNDCSSLGTLYLQKCTSLSSAAFRGCIKLSKLFLLSPTPITCTIAVSSYYSQLFSSTPFSNSSYLGYFGSIYVPSSLVSIYCNSKSGFLRAYVSRVVGV